ncbi:GntR family transcriptional regulator [Bradyrhizobium arachidis]|uniref:GntR family transcriptional regulator n=1 Tax=Bradyrhizobium arachidis TaxID=858423 RepID=UPI0021628CC7|nr:GntR family transcriptional regulator [Bradyrhizobium arachidis]UVO33921.1 GntR family transcriptional regulator [Bradyrhizobium arachidis]
MNETSTHTARALVALRRQILSGDLPGGTRLLEVAVAERLQISRTPAREAMARLVEEGLIERTPNGFAVRSFDYADVMDTLELRGVLEGTAARLAAERGVSDLKMAEIRDISRQLDRCFDAPAQDVDLADYIRLNSAFHEALWRLPGSQIISRELMRINQLPFVPPSALIPTGLEFPVLREVLLIGQRQHRGIIEAIAGREGARAEALTREHARTARDNVTSIVGKGHARANIMPVLATHAVRA